MEIRAYTQELEGEVAAFNQRLRTAGIVQWQLPGSHTPRLPRTDSTTPYQEYFVTVHESTVIGGYILTHRRFALRGAMLPIACGPQLNLSEGLIDQRYSMVSVIQLQEALRQHPLMYGLGMAGTNGPLARLFAAMGWTVFSVPLFFRVISPNKFFANLTYLRSHPGIRPGLDLLTRTPLPRAVIRPLQMRLSRHDRSVSAESCDEFGPWVDTIWRSCRNRYPLIAERDCKVLNYLYPRSEPRFLRLKVSRAGSEVGWAVMLAPRLSDHQYFGNMLVGSIVDCMASPEDAHCVIRHATRFLEECGVDLVVSTQASNAWCRALFRNGYIPGPSNVALALSPRLAERLQPFGEFKRNLYVNRGDGEGPTVL